MDNEREFIDLEVIDLDELELSVGCACSAGDDNPY